MTRAGFLGAPELTAEAQRLFDDDLAELGHVMNASRLWAYQPTTFTRLFDLLRETSSPHGLSFRHRGILVTACASAFGDSYCSLAWGCRLAEATDPHTASEVLLGDHTGLTPGERVMADWARKVVRDPHHTDSTDIQALRATGWSDAQIFAITAFVALRVAFSTINNALGATPDAAFLTTAPKPVLDAITYGRPIDG